MRGNCYVTAEALFHNLGGRKAGWKPMFLRLDCGESHWFLKHESGLILDASAPQFRGKLPNYSQARGHGFLTVRPSKRARVLMKELTWQS
jgi:hypothetical protein